MEKVMQTKNGTILWYDNTNKEYKTDNWNDVESALNEDINGNDKYAAHLASEIMSDIISYKVQNLSSYLSVEKRASITLIGGRSTKQSVVFHFKIIC